MLFPDLVPGRFLRRDNRFRATVRVNGSETWAHVPNSGRLTELFTPQRPIWLAPVDKPGRKTAFDLKLVEYAGVLVSVDARLPNPLFAEALAAARLPAFPQRPIQPEVRRDESRLDFRLGEGENICWVETKSVTLVEEGVARFPDAPTSRGRRHLQTLLAAHQEAGEAAAVVFVIQRPDAVAFAPHETADPAFAATLRQVAAGGVTVHALTCHVSLREIRIAGSVPVWLGER